MQPRDFTCSTRFMFRECLLSRGKSRSPSLSRARHVPILRSITLLACCWLLGGCSGETVFQSDFAKFPTHWPPIGNQKVGSAAVDPLSDQYVWASGTSVVISRGDHVSNMVPRAALLCNFSEFKGDATYVFSSFLNMRSGAGAATIQFEPFNQPVTSYDNGFLHLDLMPDNTVRIDDNDATKFGTFPRDQEFILQVTLKINPTPPRASCSRARAPPAKRSTKSCLPMCRWHASTAPSGFGWGPLPRVFSRQPILS